MYNCASRQLTALSLLAFGICVAMASSKAHCLLLLMQLLHILLVSSLALYFIVCSLVNHVIDERKKEEAKARATAGKCHDIIIIVLIV